MIIKVIKRIVINIYYFIILHTVWKIENIVEIFDSSHFHIFEAILYINIIGI